MGRSPCCDKTRVKRGPWSQEEDAVLRSFVQRFGNAGNWIALPQKAGLKRCGKSCRLRWLNYLRPELRHGGFTDEEDSLILSLYGEIGSKWSVIASRLPGRTDNDVKNYWNTKLKKRYLASSTSTTEARPPPPSPPATPSGGDDSSAAAAGTHHARQDEPSLPLTTPPALTDLDTAFAVVDDDMLLFKSEQLYAELVGLVEKHSQATAGQCTDGGEANSTTATPSSSSSGTTSSPMVSSSSGSCALWPTDAHGTTLLSEPTTTSLLDDAYGVGDAFRAALPAYSFQDLLASSYDDVTAAVTQELLKYYQ